MRPRAGGAACRCDPGWRGGDCSRPAALLRGGGSAVAVSVDGRRAWRAAGAATAARLLAVLPPPGRSDAPVWLAVAAAPAPAAGTRVGFCDAEGYGGVGDDERSWGVAWDAASLTLWHRAAGRRAGAAPPRGGAVVARWLPASRVMLAAVGGAAPFPAFTAVCPTGVCWGCISVGDGGSVTIVDHSPS